MLDNLSTVLALVRHKFLLSFIFLIVVDDKGGIGKSLIAQICGALLRHDDEFIVRMIDTDFSNSTTAQVVKDTKMLDLGEQVAKGILLTLLKAVQSKLVQHIVMDVGAREEQPVRGLLPWLVQLVRRLNGRIVIVRPITLGSHNQRSAAAFMDLAEQLHLPVMFVRNQGQGRHNQYFRRWIQSETRTKAIARGAVETVLEDANVLYADEATGFGLSIADCALQDFSKLSDEDRAEAEAFFDDDVAAHLNEWLRSTITAFGAAVEEAIAKRDALDAPQVSSEEPGEDHEIKAVAKAAKSKPRQA